MYFHALKIFCDVVRFHSFSRGAEANSVSQSAASQAVHQLEKQLGVQVIDRTKRPWVLTPEGKFFFDGCQDIVDRYLELQEAVRRRQAAAGLKVRVAAIYSVGLQDMSQYVRRFQAVLPGSDVDLEYMHPDRVYETVLSDQADLGLISFAHNGQELITVPWREEPMVLACLPAHRLARQKSIRPADLAGERFVAFERGLSIRRELDRFLKRHHLEVEVVAEFDNIATIKQAVEEGAGVAILPEPTLRREVERRTVVAVPFAGKRLVRPLSIIHRRKRRLGSAVLRFMDLLRQGNGSTPGNRAAGGAAAAGREPGRKRQAGATGVRKRLDEDRAGSSRRDRHKD